MDSFGDIDVYYWDKNLKHSIDSETEAKFKRSNELYHYGMPRRSGRYPWGSGERPYQSVKDALSGKRRSDYFTSERVIPKGSKMFRTVTDTSSVFKRMSQLT